MLYSNGFMKDMRYKVDDELIKNILTNIEFRLLEKGSPGGLFDSTDLTHTEGYKCFDVANTHIDDKETKMFSIDFLRTPRMSTVAIAYLINRLVARMPKGQTYLNIGVWCGFSFFAGILGNDTSTCIGVDNFSYNKISTEHIFEYQYRSFKTANTHFYKKDYLDYFHTDHTGRPIGVYFYDGDHAYKHQLKGLEAAHPFLTVGSYILVDDTNVETGTDAADPYVATMDFISRHAQQYKIVFDVETANNAHPTFWNGLLVLKKIA